MFPYLWFHFIQQGRIGIHCRIKSKIVDTKLVKNVLSVHRHYLS